MTIVYTAHWTTNWSDPVHAVTAAITADWRHRDILTISRTTRSNRTFSDWTMAYRGPSRFVERALNGVLVRRGPVLDAVAAGVAVGVLAALVVGFGGVIFD